MNNKSKYMILYPTLLYGISFMLSLLFDIVILFKTFAVSVLVACVILVIFMMFSVIGEYLD